MEDKTILGSWCTEPYCKFIDNKHIQIELVVHIWYSYDNDSKTDVINKKLCFAKEIDFDILNDTIEILEEEKKIPEKLNYPHIEIESSADDEIRDYLYKVKDKFDEIIYYLNSKGE